MTGASHGSDRTALPVPLTEAGREGLATVLADPGRALIGLDFDGTLAPIVPDPAAARALPEAVSALSALARAVGTLAVITGRPAAEAVDYASLAAVPGVVVLGQYGRQRWEQGRVATPEPAPGIAVARALLGEVMAAAPEGSTVEDKGDALAVHTRRTADPAAAMEHLRGPLAALAARSGLELEPGRLVLELRPRGADKGTALRRLAAERSVAAVLYCGDDLGDRAAFRAVRELRGAGTPGLAVCSESAEVPELAAEADLIVDGPPGVALLLRALADALAPRGGR